MARSEQVPRATPAGFVEKLGAYYDRAERLTPLLGTRAGKGIFVVRTEDKHVGRSLFAKGGRGEMSVLARAVNLLKAIRGDDVVEGTTFIDVGANIGTTTIPALLEHGFANAVAIEPEHDNYVTLRANAALNEVDERLVALRAAASNAAGTLELVVDRTQGGKHWIATDQERRSRAGEATEIVKVETVTLDGLAERGTFDVDRVGLLWMDAQGHEGHIIQGASALTERGVPIVLEWDPKGLDQLGNRGKIEAIAAERYTHFGNMRADSSGEAPKFWLHDIDGLNDYANRFLGPSRTQVFTDILVLKLTEDEVPDSRAGDYIDMSYVIREQSLLTRMAAEADADGEDDVPRHASDEDRIAFRARQKALGAKRQHAEQKRARAQIKRADRRAAETEAAQADERQAPTATESSTSPEPEKTKARRSTQSGATRAKRSSSPSGTAKPSDGARRSSRSGSTKPRSGGTSGTGQRRRAASTRGQKEGAARRDATSADRNGEDGADGADGADPQKRLE